MKNRLLSLMSGVVIQTILGGIYAWSTFSPWLITNYGLTKAQTGFIFGLTFGVFTVTMILAGRILPKIGPQKTVFISAILFSGGYYLASFSKGSFSIILLGLGVLSGAGIGFGYICPLSVVMKWFPDKKGLVSGISLAGFGGGAILLSMIANRYLTSGVDVLFFFRNFATVTLFTLLLCATLLSDPPYTVYNNKKISSYKEIFTKPFILLSLSLFSGTFSGLLINGNLLPISIELGLSKELALISISIFSAGNFVGRIIWGQIFDRTGYVSILLSLLGSTFSALLLIFPHPAWLVLGIIGLLGFFFGSNFVIYASSISKYFGTESFASLYPICFLFYGFAGIIGPGMGGFLADITGYYLIPLYANALILLLTTIFIAFNFKLFQEVR